MATYRLKRKTFAFNLTKTHWNNFKNSTGFMNKSKELAKTAWHGAVGAGKIAVPTAVGAAAIGAGAVANELDKPNR